MESHREKDIGSLDVRKVLHPKTFSVDFNQQVIGETSLESDIPLKQELTWKQDPESLWTYSGDENHTAAKNDQDYPSAIPISDERSCLQPVDYSHGVAELRNHSLKEQFIAAKNSHEQGKSCRKKSNPIRSAEKCDPNFKGVSFCLHTQMNGSESKLTISAYFCNIKSYGGPLRSRHGSGSVASLGDQWSCSEEENCSPAHRGSWLYPREEAMSFQRENYIFVKTCASCGTRRTPLWRDAEDGTPLCNACGIRFKKYKVRCSKCWHIPKKDIKTFPNCPCCGSSLRMSVCRRSW